MPTAHTPESLVAQLRMAEGGARNVALLRSSSFDSPAARYSFVAVDPFLIFRSFGSRCEIHPPCASTPRAAFRTLHFGSPWPVLDALLARFELLEEMDLPFPLGGAFGYWGYDLRHFVEPKLPRRAAAELELPDCQVGLYDSLVVFDHPLDKAFVVSTGLAGDGSRDETRAKRRLDFWGRQLSGKSAQNSAPATCRYEREGKRGGPALADSGGAGGLRAASSLLGFPLGGKAGRAEESVTSNLSRADFIGAVQCAQRYIRAGDIYQVNLAQRLAARWPVSGWELFRRLGAVSPAPFSAYLDCGRIEIASSSPELFLGLSGAHILTRPIKGTRPRDAHPVRDAQLAWDLQTSPKELAELVMITDLLRNDLGKVCEYGTVQTPQLARLERFAQVQHLVSSVEGRLRPGVTHLAALAACFPGGSVTGAPKFRAMEIIDELEPVSRGPYCGCHGYLGFNRESQLSITIRTAICLEGLAHFHVGAGIVADSNPEAEYEETLAKAAGFLASLDGWSRREEALTEIRQAF